MRTQGRITCVYFERVGSGLAAEYPAGATSVHVDSNADFNEEGGVCVIDGKEYTYALGVEAEMTDELLLSPPLQDAVMEGSFVATTPVTDVMMATVAVSDDEAINGEDMTCIVDHPLTVMLPEGFRSLNRGEVVEVSDETGDLKVVSLVGEEGKVQADALVPGDKPDPLSDNLPPEYSPTPTTLGGLKQVFIRYEPVPNHDVVTYELHVTTIPDAPLPTMGDATTLLQTGSTLAAVRELADGTPMVFYEDDGQTRRSYYFSVIAFDVDGPAVASPWVAGQMDPTGSADLVTGAVTTEVLDTVLAIVGVLQIGGDLIELSPPTVEGGELRGGIVVKDPANLQGDPLVRLHPNGCRIRADLYTDYVAVLKGLVLNGDMQVVNGRDVVLEAGISAPVLPPALTVGAPVVGIWPKNGHRNDLLTVAASFDKSREVMGFPNFGFLELLHDGSGLFGRYLNWETFENGRIIFAPTEPFFIGNYVDPRRVIVAANPAGGYRAYVLYRHITDPGSTQVSSYKIDVYSWGTDDPDDPGAVYLSTIPVVFSEGQVQFLPSGVPKYTLSAAMDVTPDGSRIGVAWVRNPSGTAAAEPKIAQLAVLQRGAGSDAGDYDLIRSLPVDIVEAESGVRSVVGVHIRDGGGTLEVIGSVPASTAFPTGKALWTQVTTGAVVGGKWPKKAGVPDGVTPWAPEFTITSNTGGVLSRDRGSAVNLRQWGDYIPASTDETVISCYTDRVGELETGQSPSTAPVKMLYRGQLTFNAPAAPPGATSKMLYFKMSRDNIWRYWSESFPDRIITFDPSRTTVALPRTPPTSSSIPDSDPAQLMSALNGFIVRGDGTGDWPLVLDPLRERLDDLEDQDNAKGVAAVTTNASGNATFSHSLGRAPVWIDVNIAANTVRVVAVSATATQITIHAVNATTGANYAGGLSVRWFVS